MVMKINSRFNSNDNNIIREVVLPEIIIISHFRFSPLPLPKTWILNGIGDILFSGIAHPFIHYIIITNFEKVAGRTWTGYAQDPVYTQ